MKVYLAGSMTDHNYDKMNEWRKDFLSSVDSRVMCYSPLRAKEYLKNVDKIGMRNDHIDDPFATPRGINLRDYHDCTKADALIVKIEPDHMSVGSSIEIAWAYQKRVPIIAIGTKETKNYKHPMVADMLDFIVGTPQEAAHIVNTIFFPGRKL